MRSTPKDSQEGFRWIISAVIVAFVLLIVYELSTRKSTTTEKVNTSIKISDEDSTLLAKTNMLPDPKPRKIHIFNDVSLLLIKLSGVGLGSMRDWRNDDLGYMSSTPYYQFGTESDRSMKNNLAIYAESTTEKSIKEIKLVLNVNNPKEANQAREKYAEKAKLAFEKMEIPSPNGFISALKSGKPFFV